MLMVVRLGLAVVLGAIGVPGLLAGPAQADPVSCTPQAASQGLCTITVTDPGDGSGGGSEGDGTGTSGSESGTGGGGGCRLDGVPVPCGNGTGGVWSNSRQCYLTAVSDYPADGPVWGGHTTGGVYACFLNGSPDMVWLPDGAAGGPPPPPNPADLAQEAVSSMTLRAVRIGIVPEDTPGKVGLIGLPTWMWVDDPGAHTLGPITRSASAGGFSVSATAKVKKVVWKMGDGTNVVCRGAGTVYRDSFGATESPDCGHTYTRDGRYTVTATTYWQINWEGMGQSGTIPMNLSRSTTITMGEAQVLVQ